MIRFWLLRALLATALVLMAALALVTALLATGSGSRWLLSQLSRNLEVQFEYVDGALLRGVRLANVHYHRPGFDLRAQQLALVWQPASLVRGALYIDRLDLTGVTVRAESDRQAAEPLPNWPALGLPVKVFVRQFSADHLAVHTASGPFLVDQIAARFHFGLGRAGLDQLRIGVKKSQLQLKGAVDLSFPYAVKAAADVQWRPEDFSGQPGFAQLPAWLAENAWQGSLSLGGDIRHMRYSASVTEPVAITGTGDFYTGFSRDSRRFAGRIHAQVALPGSACPKVCSISDSGSLNRWRPGLT